MEGRVLVLSQAKMQAAVAELTSELLKKAATDLPQEITAALMQARERETVESAKAQLDNILNNVRISKVKCASICQDPGIIVFDVNVGSKFPLNFDLAEILRTATENMMLGRIL